MLTLCCYYPTNQEDWVPIDARRGSQYPAMTCSTLHCIHDFVLLIPDEVKKVGYQLLQNRVLNVQQPTIKAIVGCDLGQLHGSCLARLFCPEQQLTQQGAICPLCDESAQDLHETMLSATAATVKAACHTNICALALCRLCLLHHAVGGTVAAPAAWMHAKH